MNLRVGISGGWEPGQIVEGWSLVYTCKALVEKTEKSGGIPLVLPIVEDLSLAEKLVDSVDFLILAGEVLSISRNVFEEHEKNVLRASNPLRYDNEAALLRAAIKAGKPVLGICRGFQVMAAELGGEVQDSDVNEDNFIVHQQGKAFPPSKTVHAVRFLEGTRLRGLVGAEHAMVNSFHRQAVRRVPAGFRPAALSDDGVIEAMESESGPLMMGLQFHPEVIAAPVWDEFFKNLFTEGGKATKT